MERRKGRDPHGHISLRKPFQSLQLLLTHKDYFWYLAILVILGDVVLTQVIIRFVPYTEIDFTTYMRQVDVYLAGERDYSLIKGPSGPLVYPAGHVFIHRLLHFITSGGEDLWLAQHIYGALYIASLFLTCAIYRTAGGIPNWTVILLVLSKRLHSIYVLRLFNDCWAIFGLMLSIFAYSNRRFYVGSVLFSAAVSVKMNVLLCLPGLLLIILKDRGLFSTINHIVLMIAVQASIASPFLLEYPGQYLGNAFEFSRVFLYKWTVNWRFVSEETFLSKSFAIGLLGAHLTVLALFGFRKWCRDDGGALRVLQRAFWKPARGAGIATITSDELVTVLFISNLIGITFARSLHYQFYSWYAQQLPFIAWRTKYPVVIKLILLGAVEYAWNVFPSTSISSTVLLTSHLLLLLGVWMGYPQGHTRSKISTKTT